MFVRHRGIHPVRLFATFPSPHTHVHTIQGIRQVCVKESNKLRHRAGAAKLQRHFFLLGLHEQFPLTLLIRRVVCILLILFTLFLLFLFFLFFLFFVIFVCVVLFVFFHRCFITVARSLPLHLLVLHFKIML